MALAVAGVSLFLVSNLFARLELYEENRQIRIELQVMTERAHSLDDHCAGLLEELRNRNDAFELDREIRLEAISREWEGISAE